MKQAAIQEENSGSDRYQQIINSQGNLSGKETTSSRYEATSSVSISSGSGSVSSSSGRTPSGTSQSTGKYRDDREILEDMEAGKTESRSPGNSVTRDDTTGPGAGANSSNGNFIEDSENAGPTVEEVTVSEQFHEDYGIYEEALDNSQFFYSTVGNGGITDEKVTIELPANMDFVMEKDGSMISYASGQPLTERGSYVMKISVIEDESLPFSQQKIYKATFRFRIQEKLQTGSSDAGQGGGSYDLGNFSSSFRQQMEESAGETATAEIQGEAGTEEETETGIETGTEAGTSGTEEAAEAFQVMDENGSIDDGALEGILADALGEGYGTENMEGYNPATGMASGYDSQSGYYRHELASGEVFFTDVPNGMVTNHPVMVLTNDDLPFRVYKDGEPMEYVPGSAIEEPGSYRVCPYNDTTIYLASYAGKEEPLFQFRILGERINDMGIVNAPEKGKIRGVWFTGQGKGEEPGESRETLLDPEDSPGVSWFYLGEDGEYEMDIETESGTKAVRFVKDTAAPRFRYQVEGGKAHISYAGLDVAGCRITKDGTQIYDGQPTQIIDEAGTYTFSVYDKAGNTNSAAIEIPYKMNTAAILVIVLVLLLASVAGVAVRRMRRSVKVV